MGNGLHRWHHPKEEPDKGMVLAGCYSDGADIPGIFPTVVEFLQKRKIIAVGDGIDPHCWR
jgi:hypothetical protein